MDKKERNFKKKKLFFRVNSVYHTFGGKIDVATDTWTTTNKQKKMATKYQCK